MPFFTVRSPLPIPVIVPPSYVGPGDVLTGAAMWWGLRAYNAAYAVGGANPAVDLVDQAGANLITINILSTGGLDLATIASWVAAHSVTTILVSKWYDQTGNGLHVVNGTNATRPSLVLNSLGLLPTIKFTAATPTGLISSTTYTQGQPFSTSGVYQNTGASSSDMFFLGFDVLAQASTLQLIAGATLTATGVAGNVFHTLQTVLNSTSSAIYIDGGAPTTGNAGTGTSANNPNFGFAALSNNFDGNVPEFGVWTIAFTSIQAGSLTANQNSYYGFKGLQTGVSAAWEFETTSWLDSSGNGNTLTPSATPPTLVAGVVGNAASLLGTSSEQLSIASNSGLAVGSGPYSLQVWVKPLNGAGAWFSKNDGGFGNAEWSFFPNFTSMNVYSFIFSRNGGGNTQIDSTVALDATAFHQLIVTWDLTTVRFYIDAGTPFTATPPTGSLASTSTVNFGFDASGSGFTTAAVDQAIIWKNRVLTPTEISTLYNGGAALSWAQMR